MSLVVEQDRLCKLVWDLGDSCIWKPKLKTPTNKTVDMAWCLLQRPGAWYFVHPSCGKLVWEKSFYLSHLHLHLHLQILHCGHHIHDLEGCVMHWYLYDITYLIEFLHNLLLIDTVSCVDFFHYFTVWGDNILKHRVMWLLGRSRWIRMSWV